MSDETSSAATSEFNSNSPLQQVTGQLALCIRADCVGLYHDPPLEDITSDALATEAMSYGVPPPNSNDVRLLSGLLGDFLRFSGQEHSKWLIDMAHDICDPAATRGSLFVWDEAQQQSRRVFNTEPLMASTYRYVLPAGVIVGLSKISQREGSSKSGSSSYASGSDNSTVDDQVKRRDGICWVSGCLSPLGNGRICPKRMGDHFARQIFRDFTTSAPIPALSVYDEIFGISLNLNLDYWFDNYEFGLRVLSPNLYQCHVFAVESPGYVIPIHGGRLPVSKQDCPKLHGYPVSPPQPTHAKNPPAGLIRWHYLQCVLRRFAHADYKNLANIQYLELPIRMKGDSDNASTDSELDWPSAVFDRGRAVQAEREHDEERRSFTASWIAGV
ncbi:hypothetical protein B0H11DRAFT_1369122 [Mycena galericulata]|nr:hypothetical protein B0H11DRAFT_1369122 [Mycena galericulata]